MRVLIVDDDRATVDVIRDTVCWDSLNVSDVFTAYNIKEAKKILKAEQIDIVISDIEMPQGSGIDLLEWYREQELEGEFLLLTCHESFDYAKHAMQLHAFEYLLKPFDVNVMEATLRKIIRDINEKRSIKETSELGKWAKENAARLYNNFWTDIISSKISPNAEEVRNEIRKRHLDIDSEGLYYLVVSRVSDTARDREKINTGLILFILENIHMEVLLGNPQGTNITSIEVGGGIIVVSIVPAMKEGKARAPKELCADCETLIEDQKKILSSTMTCCIGKSVHIYEFYETFQRLLNLIEVNVSYYGKAFYEENVKNTGDTSGISLDTEKLENLLSKQRKMEFMSALKDLLNEKMKSNALTDAALNKIEKEVQQVIYTYLGKKQIAVTGLLEDENLNSLEKRATQSVLDMIRWANYLLDATFEHEKNIKKSFTLSDKINNYIHEHYKEPIGRNEIAEVMFLAPEYLSKVYKKETGVTLNEAIANYRVEQAKILLDRGERVSDVAEKVGFDNFTYFSTTFKKVVGVSPTQYKKQ